MKVISLQAAATRRARRRFSKRGRSTLFLMAAWYSPTSALRAAFHRLRGVNVGRLVEIGYFVILDNLYPEKIFVEDGATISARSTILAHDEAMAYTGSGTMRVASPPGQRSTALAAAGAKRRQPINRTDREPLIERGSRLAWPGCTAPAADRNAVRRSGCA